MLNKVLASTQLSAHEHIGNKDGVSLCADALVVRQSHGAPWYKLVVAFPFISMRTVDFG